MNIPGTSGNHLPQPKDIEDIGDLVRRPSDRAFSWLVVGVGQRPRQQMRVSEERPETRLRVPSLHVPLLSAMYIPALACSYGDSEKSNVAVYTRA